MGLGLGPGGTSGIAVGVVKLKGMCEFVGLGGGVEIGLKVSSTLSVVEVEGRADVDIIGVVVLRVGRVSLELNPGTALALAVGRPARGQSIGSSVGEDGQMV